MSKITKEELRQRCIDNETAIASLESILKENGIERQPLLKQLDQSIFDGLDEKWRFAAVDADGDVHVYDGNPTLGDYEWVTRFDAKFLFRDKKYDTSNWQNSLIERDIAKELTGSDLCRAILERGDKYVMCQCWCSSYADIEQVIDIVSGFAFEVGKKAFAGVSHNWDYAVPINNQGEPLTASEVGL